MLLARSKSKCSKQQVKELFICSLVHTPSAIVSRYRRRTNKFSKVKVHWRTYSHLLGFTVQRGNELTEY